MSLFISNAFMGTKHCHASERLPLGLNSSARKNNIISPQEVSFVTVYSCWRIERNCSSTCFSSVQSSDWIVTLLDHWQSFLTWRKQSGNHSTLSFSDGRVSNLTFTSGTSSTSCQFFWLANIYTIKGIISAVIWMWLAMSSCLSPEHTCDLCESPPRNYRHNLEFKLQALILCIASFS